MIGEEKERSLALELGSNYQEVVDSPDVTSGILKILGEYKMAETIWGENNSRRPDHTSS